MTHTTTAETIAMAKANVRAVDQATIVGWATNHHIHAVREIARVEIIRRSVERVKDEVLDLYASGMFIGTTITDFGQLHDFVDANCLGGMCDQDHPVWVLGEAAEADEDMGHPDMDMAAEDPRGGPCVVAGRGPDRSIIGSPMNATATNKVRALRPMRGEDAWVHETSAYLAMCKAARMSPHTLRAYGHALLAWRRCMEDRGRSLDPTMATRADAQAFMGWLESKEVAVSTQVHRFVALSTFFKWLVVEIDDKETMAASPFFGMKRPKLGDPYTPLLSESHRGLLIAATNGHSFLDRRDQAIILLMLDTGARRGEVIGLMVEDVDLIAGEVTFKNTKGERPRTSPIGGETIGALNRYRRVRNSHPMAEVPETIYYRPDRPRTGLPLFLGDPKRSRGRGIGGHTIGSILERRCMEAGIPAIHPHMLRHTWADDVASDGMSEGDIMRLGGWRSRDMLDRYGRARADRRARENFRSPVDRRMSRRKGER